MNPTNKLPSELLAEAHKAHPEIKWEWREPDIEVHRNGRPRPCGCAVALIGYHVGLCRPWENREGWEVDWDKVSKLWVTLPKLPKATLDKIDPYRLKAHKPYWASAISDITNRCRNFAEAIRRLKAVGW